MKVDTSLAIRPKCGLSVIDLIICNCSTGAYVYFSVIKGDYARQWLMMSFIIIYNCGAAKPKCIRQNCKEACSGEWPLSF